MILASALPSLAEKAAAHASFLSQMLPGIGFACVSAAAGWILQRRAAARAAMDAMPRTVIIGDIHGCVDEFRDLVAKCGFRRGVDRVVLVGDLVAKGPDSAGVIDFALSIGAVGVMGNHDYNVLTYANGTPQFEHGHHEDVAASLTPAQLDYLRGLPLFMRIPEHNVVVVHAGLRPGMRPEDELPNVLMNIRSVLEDGSWYRHIDMGVPSGQAWPGPEHLVFGHDALRHLQQWDHATGLDTGCVYGGELTALVLPQWRLVRVPARRVYNSGN